MNWKYDYIAWYRLVEVVFGDLVPHLQDHDIVDFVSQNHWLILPLRGEDDKQEATRRSDANVYFSLDDPLRIRIGLVCNTLSSVQRFRNLLHGFHRSEKQRFLQQLQMLDPAYRTRVRRKWKQHHMFQTPVFETVYDFPTYQIDEQHLDSLFSTIDQILRDGDQLMVESKQSWRALAPVVNIAYIEIPQDPDAFMTVLKDLKPLYQIVLQIKTDSEIHTSLKERDNRANRKKQQVFKTFIEQLNQLKAQGIITSAQWRAYRDQWSRHPDQRSEIEAQIRDLL